MPVAFGVLGPVAAWDAAGGAIALKGPRHRAVLARLIVARRRVVPVGRLVEDLWEEDPPPGAVGAVRTFVAALRRALEPERAPRSAPTLLVTEGPGYALRPEPGTVDAWRFEREVAAAATLPPADALARLEEALGWWRGPAYADFADEPWAHAERSRLAELRLQAAERRAEAHLALGLAARAVPDLDAHVAEHPWREDAWRLLALALYRAGRQGDALAVLRRARTLLVDQLGVDPGPSLRRLERDILHHAPHLLTPTPPDQAIPTTPTTPAGASPSLERPVAPGTPAGVSPSPEGPSDPANPVTPAGASSSPEVPVDPGARGDRPGPPDPAEAAGRVWARAAAAYDRAVPSGARARLESTVSLLRNLAVTGGGGLEAARGHRVAAIAAAQEMGDPLLTARVIGAYDVPAIWTRSDDPEQAARVVAAAERTLTALPPGAPEAARARLLATIALESRGTRAARGPEAARRAERIARGLDDPGLLAFALNGVFMQTFHRAGLAPRRDDIGAELVALSERHGLVTFEVLGRLIRLQARSALGDFPAADRHAAEAGRLSARHELPLVGVFTRWYRALRLAATTPPPAAEAEAAYRDAAALLDGAGMPGLERGLLPLALLCLRLSHEPPSRGDERPRPAPGARVECDEGTDWGPYEPWVRPLASLARGRRAEAAAALRRTPEPPRDLLFEALWCLTARAAVAVGDRETMGRAYDELAPAAAELAGAGSGLLTLGPVSTHLDALTTALGRSRR
ncbi:BTAD domain-containing putative transcriptional regulator [Sphaerisporangium sp. TRM90804]|uniref:BTAD domain-containing putative transcriptional regulator n=1 Tax=Sphaerisporangium sp. TRM90804 TaxID=3031113 RepID=UPI00244D3335|nr:BTAD domain-containing putative transcriptional regulator [Sphaerisporangium sp. TRM90804]MDH2425952.1 BTAD domain-containing putative transcriptional regulator [Sphaerisporangium sp. TRM90804]